MDTNKTSLLKGFIAGTVDLRSNSNIGCYISVKLFLLNVLQN